MAPVARLLLLATTDGDAPSLAAGADNKLLGRTNGPFRVISVQFNTVTIHESGIPATISTNLVTHATTKPASTILLRSLDKYILSQAAPHLINQLIHQTGVMFPQTPKLDEREHTVDRMMRHIKSGQTIKYVVCLYQLEWHH